MTRPKGLHLLIVLILIAAAGTAVWWFYFRPKPLVGFAHGNGRIEATEVDIATKFYGRIAEIYADEGDRVEAGQIVARMDTKSLEAQLREAEASVISASKQRSVALSIVSQRKSELNLAKRNLARSERLYENNNIPLEKLDSDRAAYEAARACSMPQRPTWPMRRLQSTLQKRKQTGSRPILRTALSRPRLAAGCSTASPSPARFSRRAGKFLP